MFYLLYDHKFVAYEKGGFIVCIIALDGYCMLTVVQL